MPRLRRRTTPQDVANQMLASDMKMLEKAKLLGSQKPGWFEGSQDDWLAECARSKQSETPFFLRDAAEMRTLAIKREEAQQAKPTVLIIVSEAPKSVEEWQKNAHAIQAQHEADRVRALIAIDVDAEPAKS